MLTRPSTLNALTRVADNKIVAIDFETSREKEKLKLKTFLMQVAFKLKGKLMVLSCNHFVNLDCFHDESFMLVMHHAAFDLTVIANNGIKCKAAIYDTMIAASVAAEGTYTKLSLKHLAFFYLGEVLDKTIRDEKFETLTPRRIAYGEKDVEVTYRIREMQPNINPALVYLESQVTKVTSQLNKYGIKVDRIAFAEDYEKISDKFGVLQAELADQNLPPAVLSSPKKLLPKLRLLGYPEEFEDTSDVNLALHAHSSRCPITAKVRTYRKLSKLMTTYYDPIKRIAFSENPFMFPEFLQVPLWFNETTDSDDSGGAKSGRFSSKPNLQNMPRGEFRRIFVPREGHIFLRWDLSQIQMVIAAHIFKRLGDSTMSDLFDQKVDLHIHTAMMALELEASGISVDERTIAKILNFAKLFLCSPRTLGLIALKNYNNPVFLNESLATRLSKKWDQTYPGLKLLVKYVLSGGPFEAVTPKPWCRRRRFPEGSYPGQQINNVIQGGEADFVKFLGFIIEKAMPMDYKIILQVHDEYLNEVPIHKAEDYKARTDEIIGNELDRFYPSNAGFSSDLRERWFKPK